MECRCGEASESQLRHMVLKPGPVIPFNKERQ